MCCFSSQMQVGTIGTDLKDLKRESAKIKKEIKKDLRVSMNNITTSAEDKFVVQVIKVYFASLCKIWWNFTMFLLTITGAGIYRRALNYLRCSFVCF